MPETLPQFLKQRTVRACRAFQKEFGTLSTENALHDASPHWQTHRWGIGQNGSIVGIVFHVTAWLALTLPVLQGGEPQSGAAFDPGTAPAPNDWQGTQQWFAQTADLWTHALLSLPDVDFDRAFDWEGKRITIAQYVVEMYEHFLYHDGQIQYLKQRHLADAHGNR